MQAISELSAITFSPAQFLGAVRDEFIRSILSI